MKVKFIKGYYCTTKKDKEGKDIAQNETYPMYTFQLEKNYYSGDKNLILKATIQDLEDVLEQLKELDRNNDTYLDTWDDSIGI